MRLPRPADSAVIMERRTRILAVDDEQRGVELVKRVLRRIADVDTTLSGEEGWELFQRSDFDLVISDQRMPGISGVDLLAKIAEASADTGRILLTGYADTVDTVDAINRARVHAYLSKPCPPDQLSVAVDSVLERVKTLRENQRLLDLLEDRSSGGGNHSVGADPAVQRVADALAEAAEHVSSAAHQVERLLGDSVDGRDTIETLIRAAEQVGLLTEELLKLAVCDRSIKHL